MSNSEESSGGEHRKYAGVRRRKWGKWVSEIRIPGTRERLWLGSYSSPEGAAVAHDVAMFGFRGPSVSDKLNFPLQRMPSTIRSNMSPRSVQKAASDAGMAVDASLITSKSVEEDRDDDGSHRNSRNAGDHGSGGSGDSHLITSKSVEEDRDDAGSHRNSRNAGDHGSGGSGDSHLTVSVDDYI